MERVQRVTFLAGDVDARGAGCRIEQELLKFMRRWIGFRGGFHPDERTSLRRGMACGALLARAVNFTGLLLKG